MMKASDISKHLYLVWLYFLSLSAVLGSEAAAQSQSEYSRQELFNISAESDPEYSKYALDSKFKFPDSVRKENVFGIDISHHQYDACKTELRRAGKPASDVEALCKGMFRWADLKSDGVGFVYMKISDGDGYTDPAINIWLEGIKDIPELPVGYYHFMRASPTPQAQFDRFKLSHQQSVSLRLPPALDLEMDLIVRDTCKVNAVYWVKNYDGSKIKKCDIWSDSSSDEIISKVNSMIDLMRAFSSQEPFLYTVASWWSARIGSYARAKELHTSRVWIADYGRSDTEKPRSVVDEWTMWQFTDASRVRSVFGEKLVDASLFRGDADAFKKVFNLEVGK
jgi:GH25 family lysozyme M1 (1,4-beta-N-acetylmuramidase)